MLKNIAMSIDPLEQFFTDSPGLLFIADGEGALRRRSRTLSERFGDKPTLSALLDEGDDKGARALEAFLAALASPGADASCTLRARDSSGAHQDLRCLGRRSSGDEICGQLELVAPESLQVAIERGLLRKIMDTLDVAVWAVDREGVFIFHDGKALVTAGLERGQFLGLNIYELYPANTHGPIIETLRGTTTHTTNEAHGVHWESWNIPITNAAGEVTHAAGVTMNITEQVETRRELERQLETIREQQRAILELSAPVLNVWDHVVTAPLIGSMDRERTDELSERLLAEVHRARTRFAILDLTGVDAVDTSIANHILRLLESMRLLGVEGLVTGVSPQVAQTMVGVGIDFEQVQTHRSLREALRYCMRELLRG